MNILKFGYVLLSSFWILYAGLTGRSFLSTYNINKQNIMLCIYWI